MLTCPLYLPSLYIIIWNWLNSGDRTNWRMLVWAWPVAGSNGSLRLGPHLHHVRLQRRHGLHLHPQQEYYQIHQDEVIFSYINLYKYILHFPSDLDVKTKNSGSRKGKSADRRTQVTGTRSSSTGWRMWSSSSSSPPASSSSTLPTGITTSTPTSLSCPSTLSTEPVQTCLLLHLSLFTFS